VESKVDNVFIIRVGYRLMSHGARHGVIVDGK
jgi:hypothetical protein